MTSRFAHSLTRIIKTILALAQRGIPAAVALRCSCLPGEAGVGSGAGSACCTTDRMERVIEALWLGRIAPVCWLAAWWLSEPRRWVCMPPRIVPPRGPGNNSRDLRPANLRRLAGAAMQWEWLSWEIDIPPAFWIHICRVKEIEPELKLLAH
ncbi:hypothetical protein KC326_g3 [Hortaea werneckii]|nr:hypothetical protein KC326_g3 [Hortaea werneckii]